MSKSTWTGAVSTDWADADNWSPAGVPGAASDVVIASGTPIALASASIGTVNSITNSSHLSFESAGTNTVTTTLDNSGGLRVDRKGGAGGTILNIGGTLTNSGSLLVGKATLSVPDTVTAAALDNTGSIYLHGSSANQALLDVTAGSAGFGVAGILSGYARLAGDSAIEFASGEITSLAAGSHLGLVGSDAFIEDSTATGSNSALAGLASIGAGALFALHDGAKVSTTGALANDGNVYLDPHAGDGGSSLTLAGALTNRGSLHIGNTKLSAPDEVTTTSLSNTGAIYLTGSSGNHALLDVTAGSAGFGAAGVLSGNVGLSGDSAIEFASGEITSLAGSLVLTGNDAFIEDGTKLGSNSALTGLASISAGARFDLEAGASVSTGALVNDGTVALDPNGVDEGGSNLTVAGALTNAGDLYFGAVSLSASDEVTAASIDNTGNIGMVGYGPGQVLLDVTGSAGFGAAGVLSGNVGLTADDSAIEFAGGQINTIATGASLDLSGGVIEDSTALGSNSALTGLSDIAGSLYLDSESVTTGALANSGLVSVGSGATTGSSTLSIAGALTNTGRLSVVSNIAPEGVSYGSVAANSFVNRGTVDLGGSGEAASLAVSGTTTNNGSISISTDTEELAGAVVGTGSFSLGGTHLLFDSSVSSGQTINETGEDDALTLKQAQSFAATISGFGTGDTIDATNFLAPPATTYNFVENIAGTGGTLMLTDTSLSLTAKIHLTGHYSNSSFTLAPDSGTGTLVKFA